MVYLIRSTDASLVHPLPLYTHHFIVRTFRPPPPASTATTGGTSPPAPRYLLHTFIHINIHINIHIHIYLHTHNIYIYIACSDSAQAGRVDHGAHSAAHMDGKSGQRQAQERGRGRYRYIGT
jgi:hypothetical protein